MPNDIKILNSMLFLTVKEEIKNLKEESSIYIPRLAITFDIQIETTDIENKFATVRIEKIEPSNLENITLVEYIAKELEEKLKEDIEKNIKKSLYLVINYFCYSSFFCFYFIFWNYINISFVFNYD